MKHQQVSCVILPFDAEFVQAFGGAGLGPASLRSQKDRQFVRFSGHAVHFLAVLPQQRRHLLIAHTNDTQRQHVSSMK